MRSAPRRTARWLIDHAPLQVRQAAASVARRTRSSSDESAWVDGAGHEMDHWRHIFADDPDHVAWLTSSHPIGRREPLHRVLTALGAEHPRVLDVGAGPITPLGDTFEGKPVDLVAVDTLADRYNALLDELGITPPTRTLNIDGEKLLEAFPAGSFDVACAHNALDHCYDPLLVIAQMVDVVRPGGKVLLDHWANEGVRRLYRGMHLWNLDERDGHLIVWNPHRSTDVTEDFSDRATFVVERNENRILAIGTKLPSPTDAS